MEISEGEDGEGEEGRGEGGLGQIRVEGLFSVWLRPDGRRMASVVPGPCAVQREVGWNALLFSAFFRRVETQRDCCITVDYVSHSLLISL